MSLDRRSFLKISALWQMSPHTARRWILASWPPGVPNWKDAPNTHAVEQLHHIRELLYSHPYFSRIPDQSLIISGQGKSNADRVQATRDGTQGKQNATYLMAYMATPVDATINTRVIASHRLNTWWFNPATEKNAMMRMNLRNTGALLLKKQRMRHDAVIIADDALKHYPPPSQG